MLQPYSLEQRIHELMGEAQVPGLALAIVKGQDVLYARGFGVTSVEDGGMPVTPQTIFRIGSVTKPLTGTAIMCLVDEGKLALDEPVTTYLPWLTLSEPGAAEQVTVRMLMCHRSGLPFIHQPFGPRDGAALAARIRHEIPQLPLVAPPGMTFSYSNVGIQVLAHVAEEVTGKFYAELMQERIFDPLEMTRTTFDPTVAMTYPLAQSHAISDDHTVYVEHRFLENASQDASGRAFSTVLDVANFAMMHLHQGSFRGRAILSLPAVQEMHTIQSDANLAPAMSYGLTFEIRAHNGRKVVAHAGHISNFVARLDLVPAAQIAVIQVCNHASERSFADTTLHLAFDQLLEPSSPAPAL